MRNYQELHPEINKNRLSKAKKIGLILNEFIPDLKNKNVVDLGCSNGIITSYISSFVKSIHGFDMDISQSEKVNSPSNCSFTQCDILSLPIEDNSVDVIICNHVYHWMESADFITEVDRILKPNGFIYLAGPTRFMIKGEHNILLAPFFPLKTRELWLKIWKCKNIYKLHYLFSNQIRRLFKNYDVIPIFPYFLGLKFNSSKILFRLINNLNIITPTAVFLFRKKAR